MTRKWWVLAAVGCGTFMATLDSSIVNIALPTLTKEFGEDLHRIKWVVISYLLAVTCFLLPMGRVSDQYGRKRVYQIGFFIFGLGSSVCSVANSLMTLVIARFLQALGAAMLMANSPAVVTATFPSNERGSALGILAMVVSVGLVSGPSLGGFLISHLGWRSIFWVNLPIAFLGIFLVQFSLKREVSGRISAPFDWLGAVLQAATLISFIVLFEMTDVTLPVDLIQIPVSRGFLALFTFLLASVFIKIESMTRAPLLDLSLLRISSFATGNLAGFLMFVAFSSVTVLAPFFLEEVKHYAPAQAGLFMSAIPLMIFVVAPISGKLSDRWGSFRLCAFGALIASVTLFVMSGVFGSGFDSEVHPALLAALLLAMGLSLGLFQSPNNNAIMSAVPPQKLGVASALLATIRNLGMVTGTGLATALFTWRRQTSGAFVPALHLAFFVAGCAALAALLLLVGRLKWAGSLKKNR